MNTNRIFLLLLTLASLVGVVLAWTCLGWLEQIESPREVVEQIQSWQALLTTGVPLVYLVLLVLQMRAYARGAMSGLGFLLAWLFFALFTYVDYILIDGDVFAYTQQHEIWEGGFSVGAFLGGALMIMAGFLSFVAFGVAKKKRQGQVQREAALDA